MKLRYNSDGAHLPGEFWARLLIGSYAVLNALLRVAPAVLWPRRRPRTAGAVCVYRTGSLGDLVCALPALAAIRREYPAARLIVFTTSGRRGLPGARDVFKSISWIDEYIEYYPDEMSRPRKALRLLSRLRQSRFDVYIELPNDMARVSLLLRNMVFARIAGARWGGGWSINTLRVALQTQSEQILFLNEAERLLLLVDRCGIATANIEFSLPINPVESDQAKALLISSGIPEGARTVALAPGAKRPGNKWPAVRFADVGQELVKRGYYVVVLGSVGESQLAEEICGMIGSRCVSVAGRTDIPGAAAVIKRCDLLISNDSGLQHLASAVGIPSVAIFSFWQLRGKWYPHHPRAIVLQKKVPCHTCYLYHCPIGDKCVMGISSAEAASAAFSILDGPPYQGNERLVSANALPSGEKSVR